MKKLNVIAEQLFNQIRSRFPSVEIGDGAGNVTTEPSMARFFEFDYENNGKSLGKVSVSLSEDDGVVLMYSQNFLEGEFGIVKDQWFEFLKEIRRFAKKRLMNFEVRDINRSNLTKRDYNFLATNRSGDQTMAESKMYGTNKTSYQKIGNARIAIKHKGSINTESSSNRTKNIGSIFIESPEGEKFKFPYKHLSGARAMARHVSEGGNAYDDFGKFITGLSEEMSKLRKFKQYMGRSSVMAESLAGYMNSVNQRISEVKKTVQNLQKESFYKETFENYTVPEVKQVPDEVAENWIDQLTVKQFNEELKDVFPYIYNLVSETTMPTELSFEDLMSEGGEQYMTANPGETVADIVMRAQKELGIQTSVDDIIEVNGLGDAPIFKKPTQLLIPNLGQTAPTTSPRPQARPVNIGAGGTRELAPNGQPTGSTRGIDPALNYGEAIEQTFESLMGQFSEAKDRYKSNNKFQVVDPDYNNFAVYVSVDKIVQGKHIAVAVSNASGREPEGIKSLADTPQGAADVVKQKLDNARNDAQKVTKNASLDFNVAFTNEFFNGDSEDLGIESIERLYVKIVPGPKLIIANAIHYDENGLNPAKDGFSRGANRGKPGASKVMVGAPLSAARAKALDLVANGRYILGNPRRIENGNYEYPMSFDSIVMSQGDKLSFKSPAVTIGTSRKTESTVDEATVPSGNLYIKFRAKQTPGAGPGGKQDYLTAFAGFEQNPKDLKLVTALRKFTTLNTKNDIANMVKKLMNDKTFVSANKIILYRDSPGLESKFPHLGEFYNWMEGYKGDKLGIEEPQEDPDQPERVKGVGKKRLPKGHFAANPKDYEIPDKTMTRYFTIDNPRIMQFLRQQNPDFMQKYFRPAFKGFLMKDKPFREFVKFLRSERVIDAYGETLIMVDNERSFSESPEEKEAKTPLGEFILSYFDRETGQFPKGPTAVLTMVEKEYGEQYIRPAQEFIERIDAKVAEVMGYREAESQAADIKRLAGL